MYVLEEKIYFWLLVAIPLLLVFYMAVSLWRLRAQKKYAQKHQLPHLMPNKSWFKPLLKVITISFGLGFIAFSLVNLKAGTRLETVNREGVDIVFAVDISKSMLAEDIAPNRLEKSQQLVTQIINNLASDRIGLIAYAGSAVPQLPITTDYGSAKLFLQGLSTDLVSSQGTAINEAIELALGYYGDDSEAAKVLVIISDGEDHEGDSVDLAEAAAEKGLHIITIGVGTQKGSNIPIRENGIVKSFKKDQNGKTVITKLNATTLQEIAEAGNGVYIDGTLTNEVIEKLKAELDTLDKVAFDSQQYADFESQFQWFLAFGLFFVVLDVFYLERKTGWIKKLNLFNE